MGKWMIFFVLLLVFQIGLISAEENASITGKATSSGTSLTIVVNAAPSLNLLSPSNGTYLTGQNLDLNYTALSADFVWYNINDGINYSLSGNIQFNATEGPHTLSIYANNSHGVSSKSVVFNVNTSILIIDYDRFRGPGSEGSTNFLDYTFEELNDFSGLTLVNANYGRIYFNENINLTDDENPSDGVVNISKNVFILDKSIEIKTNALPNFDKSATISLYNLTFSNPRILIDGEVCPTAVCKKVSYSNGVLIFNVTHFTTYSVEETPAGGVPSGGGGGGSSGKSIEFSPEFEVIPNEILVNLKQGETRERTIEIKNTGKRNLTFEVKKDGGIENLIFINKSFFTLSSGETKNFSVDFISRENSDPRVYIGKLIIETEGTKKEVLIAIGISSKESLFDVSIEISEGYKRVLPGEDIFAQLKIFNFGETGRVDALLKYSIKGTDGETIYSSSEFVAVETQASLVKVFTIPEDTPAGKYILTVEVIYDGKTAVSTSTFEIIKEETTEREKLFIVVILVLIIIVAILSYFHLKKRGNSMKKKIKARSLFEL